MESRRAAVVDAFTDTPLQGVPVGVVPDAEGLSEPQLEAIARELGGGVTAFVLPSTRADRRLRFFSATSEVDRCGAATVASHVLLMATGAIEAGETSVETAAVDLDVTVHEDASVWLSYPSPTVREVGVSAEAAAAALGIDPAGVEAVGLPVARASVGTPVLVVPVDYLSTLGRVAVDPEEATELCDSVDAEGIYAFTFDTLDAEATLHARYFASGPSPDEVPVAGLAGGAAGAYLRHVGAFSPLPDELVFEQGDFAERPGRLRVRVNDSVQVGGRAVVALDGRLQVPEPSADDIIEA